ERTRVELEHVVRRVVDHIGDPAQEPPSLLFHREADELERVVLVLAERWQARARDRERCPALRSTVELDHRPPTGAPACGDDLRALAADVQLGPDRERL